MEYITFGKLCQYICEVWQETEKFGINSVFFPREAPPPPTPSPEGEGGFWRRWRAEAASGGEAPRIPLSLENTKFRLFLQSDADFDQAGEISYSVFSKYY